MASTGWDEIAKLQEALARTQQASTTNRLSERNCVELVFQLLEKNAIELVHTCDGREYLHPKYFEKEIRDELIVQGGRVNLVDLQQAINVDLTHVESAVHNIVKHDGRLVLVQGELIDRDYLDGVAEEINETLQAAGQLSVNELVKSFGLPNDFLLSLIESAVGTTIKGQLDRFDRGKLFTDSYIARQKAVIRGAFSAIMRPTPVSTIIKRFGFDEQLVYSVLQELTGENRILGNVQGRQDRALFVPEIFTRTQHSTVMSSFQRNGFIEFDTLTRLEIPDASKFLQRNLMSGTEKPLMLSTVAVAPSLVSQVDAAIEDAINSHTWIDVATLLPTPFTAADCQGVLEHCLKKRRRDVAHIFCEQYLASDQFVQNCGQLFKDTMHVKAEKYAAAKVTEDAASRSMAASIGEGGGRMDRKEERKRKAQTAPKSAASGSGGANSREVKGQKSKDKKATGSRKRGGRGDADVDDAPASGGGGGGAEFKVLEFLSVEKISETLSEKVDELDEEFAGELAIFLHRPLTRSYQEVARSVFLTSTSAAGASRRQHNASTMSRLQDLWVNITLFEKGILQVNADAEFADLSRKLSSHLLKTLCTELVNIVCSLLAEEHLMLVTTVDAMTSESRASILSKLPNAVRSPVVQLTKLLSQKSIAPFMDELDKVSDHLNLQLKRVNKKKELQIGVQHKETLQQQLHECTDEALALHLAVMIVFQNTIHCLVHAPSGCVPILVCFLQTRIPADDHFKLLTLQQHVQRRLATANSTSAATAGADEGEEATSEAAAVAVSDEELKQCLADVKAVAASKKSERAQILNIQNMLSEAATPGDGEPAEPDTDVPDADVPDADVPDADVPDADGLSGEDKH